MYKSWLFSSASKFRNQDATVLGAAGGDQASVKSQSTEHQLFQLPPRTGEKELSSFVTLCGTLHHHTAEPRCRKGMGGRLTMAKDAHMNLVSDCEMGNLTAELSAEASPHHFTES